MKTINLKIEIDIDTDELTQDAQVIANMVQEILLDDGYLQDCMEDGIDSLTVSVAT